MNFTYQRFETEGDNLTIYFTEDGTNKTHEIVLSINDDVMWRYEDGVFLTEEIVKSTFDNLDFDHEIYATSEFNGCGHDLVLL